MLKKGLSPNKFMAWLGLMFLKFMGWRVEGEIPDIKKFVIIAAPHTSNWDFPITLAVAFALKMKIYWMLALCRRVPVARGHSHRPEQVPQRG